METIYKDLSSYSTSCISDALDMCGINGGLQGVKPLLPGIKVIGPAYTLLYEEVTFPNNSGAADYIDEVSRGSVIVIANQNRMFCTTWGDILTLTAKRLGIAGTVIDGCCRDVNRIKEISYPIFIKSTYMKSGKNRVRLTAKQVPISIGETVINPGDIIFGDDSGVIVIPKLLLDRVIKIADEIVEMEEKIINDVLTGSSLCEARKRHNYNNYAFSNNKN